MPGWWFSKSFLGEVIQLDTVANDTWKLAVLTFSVKLNGVAAHNQICWTDNFAVTLIMLAVIYSAIRGAN